MTDRKAPGGTVVLLFTMLVHAAATLALFPALSARFAHVIGYSPLPFLLFALPPVTCTALYVRARMGDEHVPFFAKQLAGGTLGMLATFLALAVLVVWQIDLTNVPLLAFSSDGQSFDGIVWFALFGVGMPFMLGAIADGAVYGIGRMVFAPLLRLRGFIAAPVVLVLGLIIGAGAVALVSSRAVGENVSGAQSSYWETLGESWGLILPIVLGVILTISLAARESRQR